MLELSRQYVPVISTKRVGSVLWENEFKFAINEILRYALEFADLEGFIKGLDLSYVSANVLQISAGSCIDNTSVDQMVLSSSQNVTITSSGVNGLDTGSVTNNTWYYIWLIKKSSDGTVSGLISLSDTSPTMPSGYDRKRLLGAAKYGTATFLIFHQETTGNLREFIYDAKQNVLSSGAATANTWTDVNCSAFVPTSIFSRWALLNLQTYINTAPGSSSTSLRASIRKNGSSSTNGSLSTFFRGTTSQVNGDSGIVGWVPTDSSGIVEYLRNTSDSLVFIDVVGYRMEV